MSTNRWALVPKTGTLNSMIKALYSDSITLHLIDEDNLADVCILFQGYPDSRDMLQELLRHYLPQYENGKRTNYGFYVLLDDQLAGMTLLTVDSWPERIGSTGADMFAHMRGRAVAPVVNPTCFIWLLRCWDSIGLLRVI